MNGARFLEPGPQPDLQQQRIGEELGCPVEILERAVLRPDRSGTLDAAAHPRLIRDGVLSSGEVAVHAIRRIEVAAIAGQLGQAKPYDSRLSIARQAVPGTARRPVAVQATVEPAIGPLNCLEGIGRSMTGCIIKLSFMDP